VEHGAHFLILYYPPRRVVATTEGRCVRVEQVATAVNVTCLLVFVGQLACQALAEGVLRSAYLHAIHL
jgi:hypothetical protein